MNLELCAVPISREQAPFLPASTAAEVETYRASLRDLGERLEDHTSAVEAFVQDLDLTASLEDLSRAREGLREAVVGLYQDLLRAMAARAAIANAVLAAVQDERRRIEAAIIERTATVRAALTAAGVSTEALVLDRDAPMVALRKRLDGVRAMAAAVTPTIARQECDLVRRVCERELRAIFLSGLVAPIPET